MNDLISREDAINALRKALCEYEDKTEKQFQESDELDVGAWIVHRIFVQNMSDIYRQTILNLPSAQQWISTEEALPEAGTSYLITRNGRVEIAYYEGKNLWRGLQGLTAFKTDSVTAWCELLQPYKGGHDDN